MTTNKRSGLRYLSIVIILIIASMLMLACPMANPIGSGENGSLTINISSGETAGSRSLEAVRFVFSGNGPSGETFTTETYEQSVVVNDLTIGEWTVSVAGYNSDGDMIVMGQSPMTVQVFGLTELSISLSPAEGIGNMNISASWDGNYTVNPSAVAVITAADGSETTENMSISGGNYAHLTSGNLNSGFYRVSIQLYDEGQLTAGSVWTVMILNGITTDANTNFENLNKTGERIVVSDTSFLLAWDTDSATDEQYRIYARERGTYAWTFIEEINAVNPEFEINNSKLAYGTWEFAVSAVEGGIEAELHSSMDDTAFPATGWFIDWIEI